MKDAQYSVSNDLNELKCTEMKSRFPLIVFVGIKIKHELRFKP